MVFDEKHPTKRQCLRTPTRNLAEPNFVLLPPTPAPLRIHVQPRSRHGQTFLDRSRAFSCPPLNRIRSSQLPEHKTHMQLPTPPPETTFNRPFNTPYSKHVGSRGAESGQSNLPSDLPSKFDIDVDQDKSAGLGLVGCDLFNPKRLGGLPGTPIRQASTPRICGMRFALDENCMHVDDCISPASMVGTMDCMAEDLLHAVTAKLERSLTFNDSQLIKGRKRALDVI